MRRVDQFMEIEDKRDEAVEGKEEMIYVAVGESVLKSKTTLFWTIRSFSVKKICLLYVHNPSNVVSFSEFSNSISLI